LVLFISANKLLVPKGSSLLLLKIDII